MKARADWKPGTDSYEIRFWEPLSRATWTLEDGEWRGRAMDDGLVIPAAITLPHELFVALRDHFLGDNNVQAIREHRDDAVAVRDRLLGLLER